MDLRERNIENNQSESKVKLANILVFILLLLAVVGVSFFVYLNSIGIDIKDVSVQELIKTGLRPKEQKSVERNIGDLKYDFKEHPVFVAYKEYLIRCMKDEVIYCNKEGNEVWSRNLQVNAPIVKTAGDYMLIAGKGAREIYVFKDRDIKWNKRVEGNIINAEINEDGYVVVLHEATGYKGAVTVFNLQGNPFFTRNIAEGFLLGARVSPSGKQVVIGSVDITGVQAGTNFEFTDILGKPIAQKKLMENTILASMWYLNDEAAVAVSDSTVVCLDKLGNAKWKKEFGPGKIFSSGIALEKYIVLAVSDDEKSGLFQGNSSEVKILNQNGDQSASFKLDSHIINVEVFSDTIAVNSGREVYFINTKGKLLGKYTSKADVLSVNFYNKQQAAIITKSSVVSVDI